MVFFEFHLTRLNSEKLSFNWLSEVDETEDSNERRYDKFEKEAIAALKSNLKGLKVITRSGCGQPRSIDQGFFGFKVGPLVTARNLNLPDFQERLNFQHWNPSLGDLELF